MTRVVFLGQKWAGERCFEQLVRHPGFEIAGVVSNPRPDTWWRSNLVVRRAAELGIPVVANDERNDGDVARLLADGRAEAIISVQHPWIIPAAAIDAVGGAAFNLHAARLPEYAGHNAVNHVILNGDATHAVTLHWMTAAADEGDVAVEQEVPVAQDETARGLYDLALEASERVFAEFLEQLAAGSAHVPRRPLTGAPRFYRRSSIDAEREIPSPDDAADVDRRARALFFPPFEPAFFRADGRKNYVLPMGFGRYATEFGDATW